MTAEQMLEKMMDILHFSDTPIKELIEKNRDLLGLLYKKDKNKK